MLNQISIELTSRDQWVVWRYIQVPGRDRPTKVPFDAVTGCKASTADKSTWCSFDEAEYAVAANSYDGIGFVTSADDPFVGIDLDHFRDAKTGVLSERAAEIIAGLNSYTEVSPSGTGIRIFCIGKLPPDGRRKNYPDGTIIEMYQDRRFFTVTGNHLPGTPITINERQQAINNLHDEVFGPQKSREVHRPAVSSLPPASVLELDQKARAASNSGKYERLYAGEWSDYGSQSEADLALCSIMSFWTQADGALVAQWFRSSGLMREKWDELRGEFTYGEKTINAAVQGTANVYDPSRRSTAPVMPPTPEITWHKDDLLPPPCVAEIILDDRPLSALTDETIRRLDQANCPPVLFRRDTEIVRALEVPGAMTRIGSVDQDILRHHCSRVIHFKSVTKTGFKHVPPPVYLMRNILAQGRWPFPLLKGITDIPILLADGTLVESPGYNSASGLLYRPAPGFNLPSVPERPTPAQLQHAIDLASEVIYDFPFVDQASRTNTIALYLSPFLRSIIDGPIPLALVDAPKMGSGKTLLVDGLAIIATGLSAWIMSITGDDEEWRKRITAALLEYTTLINIDNVEGAINSAVLAAALTSTTWTDRRLGQSENLRLEQRAVWTATGNNLRLGLDIVRRCYLIRIDPKLAQPWTRDGFRHPDLRGWIRENRGELIAALLTIVRHWFAQGCPEHPIKPMGSFESWSRTMASILATAGIAGFLTNSDSLQMDTDDDGPQWEAFLGRWYANDTDWIKISRLIELLRRDNGFNDLLPEKLAEARYAQGGQINAAFGRVLGRQKDAIYGVYRLQARRDSHTKAQMWQVVRVDERSADIPVSSTLLDDFQPVNDRLPF